MGRLRRRFGRAVSGRKLVCLDIPDDYAFMQPELVARLRERVGRIV